MADGNVELYDPRFALNENYDSVQKLRNGYYYGTKTWTENGVTRREEIYTPEVLDPETTLLGYVPGAGGAQKDAEYVRTMMESDNPPYCVTVIASDSYDKGHALELGTNVIKSSGSEVTKLLPVGFSLGVRNDLRITNDYLIDHPELGDSTMIVIVDGVLIEGKSTTPEVELEANINSFTELKKYQVPIVYMSGGKCTFNSDQPYGNQNKLETFMKKFGEAGYNITGIKSTDGNHNGLNIACIRYVMPYLLGLTDKIDTKRGGIPNDTVSYEFLKYKPNATKLSDYIFFGVGPKSIDFSGVSYLKVNKLGRGGERSLSNLTRLSGLVRDYKNDSGLNGIVSNLEYIIGSMNGIRSGISGSTILSEGSVSGGGEITNLIASNINRYYSGVEDILSKLEKETKSVASISQATYDMDVNLAKQTEEIRKVGSIVSLDELNHKGKNNTDNI